MVGNFLIRLGSTQPWLDVQITKDGFVNLNLEAPEPKGCAPKCGSADPCNTVDLTGATVTFQLFKCGRTPVQVTALGNTVVTDAACGMVQYQWALSDFDEACLYYGTFQVMFTDGTILLWPYAMEQLTIEVF